MVLEQIRLASEALGPLLRKRGTSPALGASLRRAVQALDEALAEEDEALSSKSAGRAARELQASVLLIRGSERPADHAQLDGITKVLSFLPPDIVAPPAPPVVQLPACIQATLPMGLPSPEPSLAPLPPLASEPVPLPAETPPAPAPPLAPEPVPLPAETPPAPPLAPEPVPLPAETPPAPAPAELGPQSHTGTAPLSFPTIHLRVSGIQESLRLLYVVSRNQLATLADFETAHARMRKVGRAVQWLGPSRIPLFREVSPKHENSGRQVAIDLALGHLGDRSSVEKLLDILEKTTISKDWLPTHLGVALHAFAATEALDVLLAFFAKTSSPTLRALLLPALAERDALSAGQLLDLALDRDDEVAARAAEALAWAADAAEASLIFTWAMDARTLLRANALLFAAASLGSVAALVEVRKRLAKPSMFMGYLADALAIAGDDSDVDQLMDSAVTPNPDTTQILLAAANLGNAKTLFEFEDFDRHAPAAVLEEVPWIVLGKAGLPPRPKLLPPEKATRMLRGKPWSVSAVLDRLAAPDELLRSANRMALEIRVRTGVMPPCRLPLFASTASRSDILAQWRLHYAKVDAKLAPGDWYYQGKPASKPEQKGRVR